MKKEKSSYINNIAVSKLTAAFHTVWDEPSKDKVWHEYCTIVNLHSEVAGS